MSKVIGRFIADIVEQEAPSGTIDGVNTAFTLSSTPIFNKSCFLFLNSLVLRQGIDYSISSNTITMTTPPTLGQELYAIYIKR